MTIQIRHLPFYIAVALYLGVIYNLYFIGLEYAFSFDYLPWIILGSVAATAVFFFMLNLIMRPRLSFFKLNVVMNNLTPPDPFKKHIYLFRVYYLVFVVQFFYVWKIGKNYWGTGDGIRELVMLGIYLAVLAYVSFIYTSKIEPLIVMRERSRF